MFLRAARRARHLGRRHLSAEPKKTADSALKTTPSPLPRLPVASSSSSSSSSSSASGPVHSVLRIWTEGAVGAALIYGAAWGLEEQQVYPVQIPVNSLMHVCAGGVGLSFVARARGTSAARRLGVGVLVSLWGLSGGLPNSVTHRNRGGKNSTPALQRATEADPTDVFKDVGRTILATIPFAAATFRKRVQRFSARHVLGLTFGSVCLAGSALCNFRPLEAEFLWRPTEAYSRHPGLFLSWCHWFSYVMLGGGLLAFVTGPGAMFATTCYVDLPILESKRTLEMGPLVFREQQRTVSAFWPIKFSNRYVSDRRLYESVPVLEEETGSESDVLLGEWVVEHEFRPWTDQMLGRVNMTSDTDISDATAVGVLVTKNLADVLEVRFSDGRAFQMRAQAASKFTLEPLKVEDVANSISSSPSDEIGAPFMDILSFWARVPEMFANWMASDSWRLDPNECWVLQSGGEGDGAYVVLSDGDMKTRHIVLRRPGNPDGKLVRSVLTPLVDRARAEGFGK